MAMLMVMAGGCLIAFGLTWAGVQGLRGVPDSNGKMTSKGTAIALLVFAALVLVGALLFPMSRMD